MTIPAPDYNNGYHNSLRQYTFGDTNGYGSGGTGSNSALQNYEQQLLQYITNVKGQLSTLQQGTQNYALLQNYIQTAYGYLQSVDPQMSMSDPSMAGGSPWDPMSGGMSGTGPVNGTGDGTSPAANQYGEMIWQDSTRVKWDGADPVVYKVEQQGEKRQEDFFQNDVTIQIPYHGATAKYELKADDSVAAPAQMLQVTITLTDGSQRVVCVHNVTAKSKINLQSVDPDNVKADASISNSPLAAQVTVGDIGSAPGQGGLISPNDSVPPDEISKDGKTATYKTSPDVDITPNFDDSNKVDNYEITAPGIVTLHGTSYGDSMQVVDYNPTTHEWTIKVYKDGKDDAAHTKTIHIKGGKNTKVVLDVMDQSSIIGGFLDHAPLPETDAAKLASVQIGLEAANGNPAKGQPASATYSEDTPVDDISADGKTATYNSSTEVSIHADLTDNLTTHNITTNGTVTINATDFGAKVDITKNQDGSYKITVSENGKTETFNVVGPPSKINIKGALPKNVTYNGKPYAVGVDNTISMDGAGGDEYPATLKDLMSETGDNETQILNALHEAGYTKYKTIGDLVNAINNGTWPASEPTDKLVRFLYYADNKFKDALNGAKKWDATVIGPAYKTATQRLVVLLQKLYPNVNIAMTNPGASNDEWPQLNQFTFGNHKYSYTNENQDHTSEIQVGFLGLDQPDPSGVASPVVISGDG